MKNESNYDNDIPVAPSLFVTSPCQFAHDEWYVCGRSSVACTRCGEDTQLCKEHSEGLCAECRDNDSDESGRHCGGDHCNNIEDSSFEHMATCLSAYREYYDRDALVCGEEFDRKTHEEKIADFVECGLIDDENEPDPRKIGEIDGTMQDWPDCECAECREPDPREKPMSDAGKFLFELGMDLNRVYMAGMKAGMK